MSKAANIYWDNSQRTPRARRATPAHRRPKRKAVRRTVPWWLSFLVFTSIFGMLLVSINFRAFSEMRQEADENVQLSERMQNLMDENLALQEEIHSLKTDPRVIEREARSLGMDLRQEKVPMPVN